MNTMAASKTFAAFQAPYASSRPTYDYLIAGMGCAGLSLAVHLIRSGLLEDRRLLLIDRDSKQANDRTWCFWETEPGPFEDVVFRRWPKAWFHSEGFSKLLDLTPYEYKMIRGADFYRHCLDIVRSHPNAEVLQAEVSGFRQESDRAVVSAGGREHDAAFVFNSIFLKPPSIPNGVHHLLQHFKGWIVKTPGPAFRPDEATLMDFRPSQEHGTTFVYVMPLAADRALVEYTLFSPSLLKDGDYDAGLRAYMDSQLGITEYEVEDTEFGIIPMTNHRFETRNGRILNLGTAGGQTKASSGFTFRFIQKHTARIVDSLKRQGHPFDVNFPGKARFDWYDSTLLNILSNRTLEGSFVFRQLFRRNSPSTILRFLDNETNPWQEMWLLNTLPQWPFMKAGIREWVKGSRQRSKV